MTDTKDMGSIPRDAWGLPDEETLSCTDGLVENHHYRDLRWIDWGDYADFVWCEDEILSLDDPEAEDEDDEQLIDNQVWMLDIDPGVASTVAALAALGAVPFTSCNGAAGHVETHPLVGFWAEIDLAPQLSLAAKTAGVELVGLGGMGLLVFHEYDCGPMIAFAEALRDQTLHPHTSTDHEAG